MNDFQGRHATTDDAILSSQVKGDDFLWVVLILFIIHVHVITGYSAQQCIYLILVKNGSHGLLLFDVEGSGF